MFDIKHIDLETMKKLIHATIAEHGVRNTVSIVAEAMQDFADDMSDMGLKEKSVQAANMVDVLHDLNGD